MKSAAAAVSPPARARAGASARPSAGAVGARAASAAEPDTRTQVARSLLEFGPQTASVLAERFGLTTAAVRRHLDTLLADGAIVAREQSSYGPRGRGRPAKVFALTDSGRDLFDAAYDTLAVSALRFLAETAGEHAVREFAARHVGGIEARCRGSDKAVASDEGAGRTVSVDELLVALNAAGYSASATTLPGGGVQICQHHCPVAHVAAEFPQLCEAETESFARVLGTHVQRLATIAHGDGVCTTHIPLPATTAPKGAPETPVTPRPASRRTTR